MRSSFEHFLNGSSAGQEPEEASDVRAQLLVSRCKETQLERELHMERASAQAEILNLTQKFTKASQGFGFWSFLMQRVGKVPIPACEGRVGEQISIREIAKSIKRKCRSSKQA